MKTPAATAMTPAAHGGFIATGSMNVRIGKKPAARVGDTLVCPQHGVGTISRGSSTVRINGRPAARFTDLTGCLVPGMPSISSVLGLPLAASQAAPADNTAADSPQPPQAAETAADPFQAALAAETAADLLQEASVTNTPQPEPAPAASDEETPPEKSWFLRVPGLSKLREKVKYDKDGNWARTWAPEAAKKRLTEAELDEIKAKREEMAERGEQMEEPGEKMNKDSDKAERWVSSFMHIESNRSDNNKDGKSNTEKWYLNGLRLHRKAEWGTIKEDDPNASGNKESQTPAAAPGTSSAAGNPNASGDEESQTPAAAPGKKLDRRFKTTQDFALDLGYAIWRKSGLWDAKKEPQPASAANDSTDNSNEPVVAPITWTIQNIVNKVKKTNGFLNGIVELDAAKLSLEGTATYSATCPKSLNPFVLLGIDVYMLRARLAELDLLIGYDGKRIGLGLKVESGIVAIRPEVFGMFTIPLRGYSLQLVSGIATAPWRLYLQRIGAWIYYDTEDGRLNFGFTGMGKPAKMWANVVANIINQPKLIPNVWVLQHVGIEFEGSFGRKAENDEEKAERLKKKKEKEEEKKEKEEKRKAQEPSRPMPGAWPDDDDSAADPSDQSPGFPPDDRYGSTIQLADLSGWSAASIHESASSMHESIPSLQEAAPAPPEAAPAPPEAAPAPPEAAPAPQRAAASTSVVAEEEAPGLPSVNLPGLGVGIPGTIMAGNPTVRIGG